MLTISVDTGGTFTDGYFQRDDRAVSVKVDTTPHDPVSCLMSCLDGGAAELGLSLPAMLEETTSLRYATTLSTNAIIQKRGVRVGALVSPGAAALGDDPVAAILDAEMVADVPMRDGGEEIDEPKLLETIRGLLQGGARAIVVALDESWLDPEPERRVRAIIKAQFPRHYLGAVPIVLSSDISAGGPAREARNAAVVNAYIHQIMARYLYRAGRELRVEGLRSPLLVAHSSGGVARVAKTLAINTYGSGPGAGLFAGAYFAGERQHGPCVLLDVGGTSSDIAVTDGSDPEPMPPAVIEGIEAAVPMIHVNSIGGGGGSILRADGDRVKVGPDSAGASPGPACYGLGGSQPTVTDANVALGLIDPEYFLGGKRRLDPERARKALESVAEPLGLTVEEAAAASRRAVDEIMAKGIEAEVGGSVEPGQLTLLAFGGGGGLHGANVARQIGVPRILVPRHASVLSAYGGSLMDVRHLYERWVDDATEAEAAAAEMREAALVDMKGEGFEPEEIEFELSHGAADEPPAPIGAAAAVAGAGLLRLAASARLKRQEIEATEVSEHQPEPRGTRPVYWPEGGGAVETRIYRADDLRPGARLEGPAIVEAPQTTVAVPVGFELEVDGFEDIVLRDRGE